jgi:hypothetical protein
LTINPCAKDFRGVAKPSLCQPFIVFWPESFPTDFELVNSSTTDFAPSFCDNSLDFDLRELVKIVSIDGSSGTIA